LTRILEFATRQLTPGMVNQYGASAETNNCQGLSKNNGSQTNAATAKFHTQDKKLMIPVTVTSPIIAVRPWDVLVKYEWNTPHIILQQCQDSSILHAFVPSDGPYSWSWQEVPVSVKGGQSLIEKNNLKFIPPHTALCEQPTVRYNRLFDRVEQELTEAFG